MLVDCSVIAVKHELEVVSLDESFCFFSADLLYGLVFLVADFTDWHSVWVLEESEPFVVLNDYHAKKSSLNVFTQEIGAHLL